MVGAFEGVWCRLTITLIWLEMMHMWWALKCRTREAQRKISHSLRKSRISYMWQFLWSVQNELPQSWYEEHSSVKSDRHRRKHEAWEKWIQNPKVYFNTISSKVSTFHFEIQQSNTKNFPSVRYTALVSFKAKLKSTDHLGFSLGSEHKGWSGASLQSHHNEKSSENLKKKKET